MGWVVDVIAGLLIGTVVIATLVSILFAIGGAGTTTETNATGVAALIGTIVAIYLLRRRRQARQAP